MGWVRHLPTVLETPGVPAESNNLRDYAHQTSGSRSDVGADFKNNILFGHDIFKYIPHKIKASSFPELAAQKSKPLQKSNVGFPSPVLYVKPELTDNILRVVVYLPIHVTLNQKTADESGSDSALSGPTHDGPTLNRPTKGAEVDNNITPKEESGNMV